MTMTLFLKKITFMAGFWMICGNPAGSAFSAKRNSNEPRFKLIHIYIPINSVIMTLIGTFIDGKVRSGGNRVPVAIFGDALISTRFLLLPHLHQTPRSKEN